MMAQPRRGAPEVSVIIPTHNRKHLLLPTLASVLAQEDVDLEVVLVDDGSRDGTSEFVEALGRREIRVIRHERPQGVGAARNAGVAAACGEWVALLDDDDLWKPEKLKLQLEAVRDHNSEWSYTGAVHYLPGPRLWRLDPAPSGEELQARILHDNVVPAGSSNVLIRRDVFHRIGGFDPRLRHMADWDMWMKLALSSPGAVVPSYLLAYRLHQQNMVLQNLDGVFDDAAVIDERYRAARGGPMDLTPVLYWVAVTYWRAGCHQEARAIYRRAAISGHRAAWFRVLRTYVPVSRLRPLLRPGRQPSWPSGFDVWLRQALDSTPV